MISPAIILRSVFIDLGLVVYPGGNGIPCYVSSMPDDADESVCIYDVSSPLMGRRMIRANSDISVNGPIMIHPGVHVEIRSLDYSGYDLANSLATAMDTSLRVTTIPPEDSLFHYIQAINRISPVIALGEEIGKKRQLWCINARMSFQEQEPSLG